MFSQDKDEPSSFEEMEPTSVLHDFRLSLVALSFIFTGVRKRTTMCSTILGDLV